MSGDRFGMKWGLAGGTTLATIDEARAQARLASEGRFDALWISHAMGVDPMVALACIGPEFPDLPEMGTSVTPLFGRHPVGLSQIVRTVQNALGGRFTLGVGAAARRSAEGMLGIPWTKPFTYTREFIDAMEPLLAGEAADQDGELVTAHAQLGIQAPDTPILLAALGPRMLRFAGERLQGTTLGQCGPKTIAGYVRPMLEEGAARSGRTDKPRILALVRINVTEDREAAKATAREISAFYQSVPSYANVIEKEGLPEPADLHLIGSWQEILDGLAAYAEAGTTDLRIQAATHDQKSREATEQALVEYLG